MGAQRESNPRGETLSRLTPQPPAPTATPKTAKTEKTKETASGVGAGIEPTRGDPIGLAGRRLNRPPPPPPGKLRKPIKNASEGKGRNRTHAGRPHWLSRPAPQPPAPTPTPKTPKTKKTASGGGAGIKPMRGDPIGLAG